MSQAERICRSAIAQNKGKLPENLCVQCRKTGDKRNCFIKIMQLNLHAEVNNE